MPQTSSDTTMTGYHGCDSANVASIKANNFKTSTGEDHWLGEGAYFFGPGISDPAEDAKQWAIAAAWDNERWQKVYRQYSVLEATITSRNLFNMTTDEGKAQVNAARKLVARREPYVRGCNDSVLLRFLAGEYDFDVLIQDFYIQFSAQRRKGAWSRMPNARVICVRRPATSVDKSTIRVISTGLVP